MSEGPLYGHTGHRRQGMWDCNACGQGLQHTRATCVQTLTSSLSGIEIILKQRWFCVYGCALSRGSGALATHSPRTSRAIWRNVTLSCFHARFNTGVLRSYENAHPCHPSVGPSLGFYGRPRGWAFSYERVTPVK